MAKLYQVSCPKCNNKTDFYRFGKDKHGHQKYQCKKCKHQWAPETPASQKILCKRTSRQTKVCRADRVRDFLVFALYPEDGCAMRAERE